MADNNFAPSQGAGGPFALSTTPGVLNYDAGGNAFGADIAIFGKNFS